MSALAMLPNSVDPAATGRPLSAALSRSTPTRAAVHERTLTAAQNAIVRALLAAQRAAQVTTGGPA